MDEEIAFGYRVRRDLRMRVGEADNSDGNLVLGRYVGWASKVEEELVKESEAGS